MPNILKSHHPVRHIKSFKYAFSGMLHALLNEANFRVQLIISAVVIWLGFHYEVSNIEWAVLVTSLGVLLSAEMANTVVEEIIDHLIKDHAQAAKVIKDLAAGFVLMSAVGTLIITLLIFAPKIY